MSSFRSPLELDFHLILSQVCGFCWVVLLLVLFLFTTSACKQIKQYGCSCESCRPRSLVIHILVMARHVSIAGPAFSNWGKTGLVARAFVRAEISGSLANSQRATELRRREFVSLCSLVWSCSPAKTQIGVFLWI